MKKMILLFLVALKMCGSESIQDIVQKIELAKLMLANTARIQENARDIKACDNTLRVYSFLQGDTLLILAGIGAAFLMGGEEGKVGRCVGVAAMTYFGSVWYATPFLIKSVSDRKKQIEDIQSASIQSLKQQMDDYKKLKL